MSEQITKPSELLIAAKAKFGPFMIRWTRGSLHRKSPITGDNYCSLGAVERVTKEIEMTRGWMSAQHLRYNAEQYLIKAMGGSIPAFNDWGVHTYQDSDWGVLKTLWMVATRLHPGSWLYRQWQVRRAWCKAIDMAVSDELKADLQSKDCPK